MQIVSRSGVHVESLIADGGGMPRRPMVDSDEDEEGNRQHQQQSSRRERLVRPIAGFLFMSMFTLAGERVTNYRFL